MPRIATLRLLANMRRMRTRNATYAPQEGCKGVLQGMKKKPHVFDVGFL